MEARRELGSRDAKRDLAAARIAEAAGAQRDVGVNRTCLDVAVIDRAAVPIVQVERDGAAAGTAPFE
jgi:hypothetical protein